MEQRKLLEDLAKAGSNIRVFNNEPGIGFPNTEERMIQVYTTVTDDVLGRHVFVEIVPKYEKHNINFFICPSNRKNDDDPVIFCSGADKKRAVVALSNGITYNIYYLRGNLPDRLSADLEWSDYNVGDLFGINY